MRDEEGGTGERGGQLETQEDARGGGPCEAHLVPERVVHLRAEKREPTGCEVAEERLAAERRRGVLWRSEGQPTGRLEEGEVPAHDRVAVGEVAEDGEVNRVDAL